jgi:signal peptidase II
MRFRMRGTASSASSAKKMQKANNGFLFWPVLLLVTMTDIVTKNIAEHTLTPQRVPHDVFGEYMRLTLVYNPGAAFGLHLGEQSRVIFTLLTLVALAILARLYRSTEQGDMPRTFALGLVCAGAVGNLLDRLRSGQGVVDFLDIGWGETRWPTFNVADMAVTIGAVLLAWVLWREDRMHAERESHIFATVSPAALVEPGDLV